MSEASEVSVVGEVSKVRHWALAMEFGHWPWGMAMGFGLAAGFLDTSPT